MNSIKRANFESKYLKETARKIGAALVVAAEEAKRVAEKEEARLLSEANEKASQAVQVAQLMLANRAQDFFLIYYGVRTTFCLSPDGNQILLTTKNQQLLMNLITDIISEGYTASCSQPIMPVRDNDTVIGFYQISYLLDENFEELFDKLEAKRTISHKHPKPGTLWINKVDLIGALPEAYVAR